MFVAIDLRRIIVYAFVGCLIGGCLSSKRVVSLSGDYYTPDTILFSDYGRSTSIHETCILVRARFYESGGCLDSSLWTVGSISTLLDDGTELYSIVSIESKGSCSLVLQPGCYQFRFLTISMDSTTSTICVEGGSEVEFVVCPGFSAVS